MNSKDLQKHYYDGTVPLYDAISLWMKSNEPCPDWLKQEYESALMKYQSGGDFMQSMGFDLTKGKSTELKRAKRDQDIKSAANLKYILDDLTKLGLPKITPANHKAENKMTKDVLQKVKSYLKAHGVHETTIESTKSGHEVEYMTAYEVAGLIFGISEGKVRELERLNKSFNILI